MATAACIKLIRAFSCARRRLFALKLARPYRHSFTLLVLLSLAFAIVLVRPTTARAFRLHVPCTGSHDCPRGAFCRHATNFRGQCITLPRTPFGITGRRLNEFPPESDPPDHIFGSMPILRCAKQKPCPPGFVCAKYGSSDLEEALCVPYSEPCWSTADCSPSDMCDQEDDELSLSGVCRPRESTAGW
ncbi:MAG: hypothetical protein ACLQU2_07615 [Candidatus Binataceae bacterium]